MKAILAVFNARNKEFFRDRSTLVWNFVFPVIMLLAFYYFFNQSQPVFTVGVFAEQDAYLTRPVFMSVKHVHFIPYAEQLTAFERLQRHQIDLVIDIDQRRYWVNEESNRGYLAERLLVATDPGFERNLVSGQAIRYIDWVLPGVVGLNVMFSSLFGVGYVIVRYRKNGMLKRLGATPLSALEFISAQLLSRLFLVTLTGSLLLVGGHLLFSTLMLGQWLLLLTTLILGCLSLISLGLLIAARGRSEELVGGFLNVATWPMAGLSEVWFSIEGAPYLVRQIADALPLTHLIQALRSIMTEGAGWFDIGHHLLILAGFTTIFLLAGALSFNWAADGR